MLWGQSIGAAVALAAAASYRREQPGIAGIELETPFTSVKDMLVAIYPQKWLPYRYLQPFLWNHWDSRRALADIAGSGRSPQLFIAVAEEDELVPRAHGVELEHICKTHDLHVNRAIVMGALHHEVVSKPQGRKAIVGSIQSLS